ncbi:MFS transporter [Segniliparus rotundus]|nr:MFS transporter [Segniliparus rotundus]
MSRSLIWVWGLWDWGAAGFSVLAWAFLFGPYLINQVGTGLSDTLSPNAWLGLGVGASGLALLLVAPGVGPWIGAGRRRHRALVLLSGMLVAILLMMSTIRPELAQFCPGLCLLSVGLLVYELATIPYNAMLRDLSDPRDIGNASGAGMAMGYCGGILLLGLSFFCCMNGDGPTRGLLRVPAGDGLPVRMSLLLGGVWLLVFSLPLLLFAPKRKEVDTARGFFDAYRTVARDLRELWRLDRRVVQYLMVSAVFRDGVVGFATFGAVLAVSEYEFSQSHLLVFGAMSSSAAAFGAAVSGRANNRFGTGQVIRASLASILLFSAGLLVSTGPGAFWAFGLGISIFIGPTLAASRTLLLEITPPGKEGEMFGLYAVSGRTVAFLSPTMFGICAQLFHAGRGGAAGIMAVLAAGLAGMTLIDTTG